MTNDRNQMASYPSSEGRRLVLALVQVIEENKTYLSEIDGKIGDGDHGINMAKGFALVKTKLGEGASFRDALAQMADAAVNGKESTRDLVAKIGRASRLGERSRGVLDAGATSGAIILQTMATILCWVSFFEEYPSRTRTGRSKHSAPGLAVASVAQATSDRPSGTDAA